MTLSKGNRVVKLDSEGKPLTTERESYIEFEVEELTPHFSHRRLAPADDLGDETYVVALLRKIA